jgi:putative transferase (TIGR04331 family)
LENLYLTKLQKILIHFKFFQIPFYKKINNIIYKKNESLNYIRNVIINSILNKKIKRDYKNFLIFFFNKIPSVFIESFNDIEKYVKNNRSYYIENPKRIITTNYFNNSILNYYLASETSKQNNLCLFQHGGVYGMSKFNMVEDLEINFSKKFYTFGWKKNKKTIPGFFYRKKISNREPKKIYLMMQNENVYPMQPQVPRGTEDFLSYLENCEMFIAELDKSLLKSTLVRYPGKLDNIKSYFCKDRLKFDPNSHLSESLSQAKFVINTVNSTVFLETMYHDIPNILLLDGKKNYHSAISNQILRELAKSKIIHYNPVEASRFVNMLFKENNICSWWSKNKENINQFKMQFCRQKQGIKWLKKIA